MKVEIDEKKLNDLFLNTGLSTKKSKKLAEIVAEKVDKITKIIKPSSVRTTVRSEVLTDENQKIDKKKEVSINDNISV